jgi:predicted NACHT family NTPase
MALRLDNRPLLSTFDDAELFVEPPALSRVRAAVSRRLNVLILGAPGAGKTTFLHRIASEVEAGGAHLPPVYVDLSPRGAGTGADTGSARPARLRPGVG